MKFLLLSCLNILTGILSLGILNYLLYLHINRKIEPMVLSAVNIQKYYNFFVYILIISITERFSEIANSLLLKMSFMQVARVILEKKTGKITKNRTKKIIPHHHYAPHKSII